jgi:hypothetical protein
MTVEGLRPSYTVHAARAAGLTRAQLRDDGVRISRGAYVSRSVPLTLAAAAHALVPLLPPDAVVSHSTAAALFGAPVPHEWPLHVTVPPGTHRPRRRRLQAHVSAIGPDEVITRNGLPLTSGPRTWLDLATVLPEDELVAVGDALHRAGHLDAGSLGELLTRSSPRGIVRARRCAPALDPRRLPGPRA